MQAIQSRGPLTKKENAKVAELQRNLDKTVVKSLSKGEVEQKAILERMKQNKGKLSMQAASNVIKESAKERDTTIKDAKKKYKDTVAEAVKQRDETGTLSKSQADKVIKNAKKQYDESKGNMRRCDDMTDLRRCYCKPISRESRQGIRDPPSIMPSFCCAKERSLDDPHCDIS